MWAIRIFCAHGNEMKALVLCAGFGTRLGELTRDLPKPLLDLCGQPLLGRTLKYLAAHNIKEVAINLHYRAEQIKSFVGDGSLFGVLPHFVYEPEPLGTAGAVRNLKEYFDPHQPFLVLYGDLLLDQDLAPLFQQHQTNKADITLLVHRRAGSNSIVRVDEAGRVVELLERPTRDATNAGDNLVNSGLYVCSSSCFDFIAATGQSDFPRDVFPKMLADGKRIYTFPLTGYRCAIDSPERYSQAQDAVQSGRCRTW